MFVGKASVEMLVPDPEKWSKLGGSTPPTWEQFLFIMV